LRDRDSRSSHHGDRDQRDGEGAHDYLPTSRRSP
jgi:hypothetical protein